MARHSDARVLRLGATSIVVLLLVMVAAFNLQRFPGFRGEALHAELVDASGLHVAPTHARRSASSTWWVTATSR